MKLGFLTVLTLLTGCAANEIRSGAQDIIVTHTVAPKSCKFKGQIMGEQGGFISGRWTSNKNLAQGAMNDMKNHAYELNANYVVLEESKAGNTGSGSMWLHHTHQTDVTQVGNAYRCPPADIGL